MTTRFIQLFKISIIILLIAVAGSACKHYVDVPPPTDKLVEGGVFTNKTTIAAAMAGLYSFCFIPGDNQNQYAGGTADIWLSVAMDDAATVNASYAPFGTSTYPLDNIFTGSLWNGPFYCIGRANAFMDAVNGSTVLTAAEKKHYIVQAKIIRAYYYSLLSTLYGDVPLAVTGDFKANALLARSPRASVDSLMLQDLIDARDELSATEGTGNYTFNKNTANGFLAKLYAYKKDWTNAETAATAVISSPRYSLTTDPAAAFSRGNTEAIFQVPNSGTSYNGFIIASYSLSIISTLTPSLVNNFEAGDLRKTKWIQASGTNFRPVKYSTAPPSPQEQVILRLADVILLRAEARAQKNDLKNAIDDVNLIRKRAQITLLPYTLTQAETITAVMKERRNELFGEGINRWFDLNRWGLMQSTMLAAKPSTWQARAALLPILTKDLLLAPNLKQTKDY